MGLKLEDCLSRTCKSLFLGVYIQVILWEAIVRIKSHKLSSQIEFAEELPWNGSPSTWRPYAPGKVKNNLMLQLLIANFLLSSSLQV